MHGHRWSDDIREAVIRASQLGVDPTVMQAITGVSQRSIQCIISEPKHGDGSHHTTRVDTVLGTEHYQVSIFV